MDFIAKQSVKEGENESTIMERTEVIKNRL